eukprot:gene7480-8271_t
MDGRPPVGNLQRTNTKRAVLIPQKTNLRFDGPPPPDSGDANGTDGVGLRKLSSNRLLSSKPSSAHQRPTSSSNSLIDPLKINGEVFDRFLESVPPIGLSREDSNIMRARVIEEMYRIQERANITPEERQRLFQLAMSMDAPRLARKLVAETEEGREDGVVGAFLTVSKLNNSSSSSVLSGVSSRDMMTGNPSIPSSSSSSSSGHHNQIQRNTNHSSQGHYSTTSLINSNAQNAQNHNNNDDNGNDSGGGEDDAFCKAFDEVERIRQRILQRASGNTIGNAIPPTGRISSNNSNHHSSASADSNSHMITLPRENSTTSSEQHSRRSSYELHPIHEFTLTDLPVGEGVVEHKDTILSPDKDQGHSRHQVVVGMNEKPGEDEGKEGNEANIIQSLDMLIDNADDFVSISSERKTVDLTAAHKGLLLLHDKLSQQPLTRTIQSEEDEEASAKERRDKFPSFSSQNVDYRNQQPLRGTLQSVDSSDSHLFQGVMENHHNNSSGSYSSSQRDRRSINDSRDTSRSNWTVMLTQSSDDSHQPRPMSGKHTASVDSIHMNEGVIPSINGGQTSLPPLGMELRQAKALLSSPLTDWIRMGKQISHTPLSVAPITPATLGPPTMEEKGKTPLISPRQMIPPLSSKTHQSTAVGTAPLRRSKFSFEPFANSPDDDHSKGMNTHTTSTISTSSAASSQPSSCERDVGNMQHWEDSPEINAILLNKVKHSLQLLGERMSSPTNVNGNTSSLPPSLTNNYTALPAIDTKISPRSASATTMTPLVSQSLSSMKMPAVQGALHLNRPTTMASSVTTSPTLSERSSSGAIRMAAELALTKQGSGRAVPLSRDTSSHSLYDQSFINGQYNMIGTPNTARQATFHSQVAGGESVKTSRSNKLALAAALSAGDAVGKLMAEMLTNQKK